jgi:hypothetical protein
MNGSSLIADECPAPPSTRTPTPDPAAQEREGVIGADAGVNLFALACG